MSDRINYGERMHEAMKGLMKDVLDQIAVSGLPGEHHFYISFFTQTPGVVLADWLRDKYPQEMTIVLQNWFDNLIVMPDRFSVTLNFGDAAEDIVIPFTAVTSFVDPSVDFGLSFKPTDEDTEVEAPMAEDVDPAPEEETGEAEVVSLDQFRNRDR